MLDRKPSTAQLNGRLWSARARDWANLMEATMSPVYEAALDCLSVTKGTSFLDIGCGSGFAARLASQRGAKVSGIDAAEGLLAIARERSPNGDFRIGDLESLPFDNVTFHAVTGFNAFQYAANPEIALREARRVCKPNGGIVITTWGRPEGMPAASMVAALRPLMPASPPGAPGPFALSDEKALHAFATSAGLKPGDVFDVGVEYYFPNKDVAVRAWNSSGVAARAMENSSAQAVSEAHARALEAFRQADDSYQLSGTFRCLIAKR